MPNYLMMMMMMMRLYYTMTLEEYALAVLRYTGSSLASSRGSCSWAGRH